MVFRVGELWLSTPNFIHSTHVETIALLSKLKDKTTYQN